jgi:hypothetical protein
VLSTAGLSLEQARPIHIPFRFFLTAPLFLLAAGLALTRARGAPHTVRAMRLAVGSLLLTVSLGLALTGALNGWLPIIQLNVWVDAHLAWGLLGWVGLLLIGVAYQVVPMFHVTPSYPRWVLRWLAPCIAVSRAVSSLLAVGGARGSAFAFMGMAALAFSLLPS